MSGKFKRSERLKEREILPGEGDTGRIRSVQIETVRGRLHKGEQH